MEIGARDREILLALLARHLPRVEVWAYGSRISGSARPDSDLDLAIFVRADQRLQVSILREALEESGLSFRVDLLAWDSLPESFKANIKASPVEIVAKAEV